MTLDTESSRDLDLASIVLVFSPSGLDQGSILIRGEQIEKIEDSIGESVQVGRTVSDRGEGYALVIRRRQMDVLLVADRVEVRSLAPNLSAATIELMPRFLIAVIENLGDLSWVRVGYNFIIPVRTDDIVISKIRQSLLKDSLESDLDYKVIGAAAWLWLEVEEGYFRLKLEPQRENPTTHRLIANANFTIELGDKDELPSIEQFAQRIEGYYKQVDSTLTRLSL
jgi:hypothetical protein